jgi:orotidine-5'-phosphate decarboxylase
LGDCVYIWELISGGGVRSFSQRLETAVKRGSPLCIGLDPVLERIPPHLGDGISAVRRFLEAILDETAGIAGAYKPNSAFFEAMGIEGIGLLVELREKCPEGSLWVLDAKRGDIGNTSQAYARAAFEVFGADAVTVNPYLGKDAVAPFVSDPSRGAFLLCRTSNPGSADFQSLGTPPLYLQVAEAAQNWNQNGNVGLVVGATMPTEMVEVRKVAPHLPLLIPGIGAQGGTPEEVVVPAMVDPPGLALISASRSILYASSGRDFGTRARMEAERLRDEIAVIIRDYQE